MSKSIGNVVSPEFAMNKFGTDTMRFYLAHDGGIENDADYSNDYIAERYRKCLAGGIGNLVQRLTKPKAWSVRGSVKRAQSGSMDYEGAAEHRARLSSARDSIDQRFVELNPRKALLEIMEIIYQTNKHVQDHEPWAKIKQLDDPDRLALTESIVYDCAEAVRIAGIMLLPYMPTKAGEVLDMLGVSKDKRTFEHATYGKDYDYGVSTWTTTERGEFATLFPPLLGDNMGKPLKKNAKKSKKMAEMEN